LNGCSTNGDRWKDSFAASIFWKYRMGAFFDSTQIMAPLGSITWPGVIVLNLTNDSGEV
jgi:hypothetical protein